jgi:hypothetical protein
MSDQSAEDDGAPAAAATRPGPLGERAALWLGLAALAVVALMTAVTLVHILARRY